MKVVREVFYAHQTGLLWQKGEKGLNLKNLVIPLQGCLALIYRDYLEPKH